MYREIRTSYRALKRLKVEVVSNFNHLNVSAVKAGVNMNLSEVLRGLKKVSIEEGKFLEQHQTLA